jgi:O-antigen biosynthesis protein
MRIRWPGLAPRIDLDWPIPGAIVGPAVDVVGWAAPRRAPIARVEAALGGAGPVPLAFGQARPDVAAAHGCDPACGFSGRLVLEGVAPGPATLEVVVTDARGEKAWRRIPCVVSGAGPEPAEAVLEVEHARWCGEELEVEGFFLPAAGATVRAVLVEVDGVVVGRARRGLSRPDLAARFGGRGEALRCGFRYRAGLTAVGTLGVRVETDDGRVLRRALARPARDERVAELARLLANLRAESDRNPSVLDAAGLGLAAALPGENVVTPLRTGALPYVDASFDVVALRDGARLADARRLATEAVVQMQPVFQTLWRGDRPHRRQPTVSVVIPAFNQSAYTDACVRSVLEAWPAALRGEVLVVDDGSVDDTAAVLARWQERDARLRVVRQPENRGFIGACNEGAAAATGELLVFLNNDTVPGPGWLPPLVSALERERAGAAGGKLVYPDGTLQEAGGVVFDDGDAYNFGRGSADPEHPLFDHVREVDYCSGAVLATPRALFQRLGGFDAAFAPAYYEDTDYAFRLRQHGYRVYYQPESVVVHLEGGTAGRDGSSGVKRHQAVNRTVFTNRWAAALAQQPVRPERFDRGAQHQLHARGRHARRALVILPTMPEADRESGSRRAFHLIELLVHRGWSVSVLVENATGGERCARTLRRLGAASYGGRETRWAGSEYLADPSELLESESFDLAIVAFWEVAERYLPLLRTHTPRTRVLVDSVDLHFLRQARAAFARARTEARGEALDEGFGDRARRELNAYGAADGVLTVSAKEAAWIDDLVGAAGHALCIPDLEDASGPMRPRAERKGLLFLGNFRHPPNVEALAFLEEIVARLPAALLAEHPLAIVGNALEPAMLGGLAGRDHVHAVGWVPSVDPYLERALVSLAPLRSGAGTKRKLLQSLLAGTPCVSTSIGAEGLDLADGREVVLADSAAGYARAIERLARDEDLWERLAKAGRARIEIAHSPQAVSQALHAALDAVLG